MASSNTVLNDMKNYERVCELMVMYIIVRMLTWCCLQVSLSQSRKDDRRRESMYDS